MESLMPFSGFRGDSETTDVGRLVPETAGQQTGPRIDRILQSASIEIK
jgi:hypothetical protein